MTVLSGQAGLLGLPDADLQAIAAVMALLPGLQAGASKRDSSRRLPGTEVDELSAAGLFGLTVPAEFGGPDVAVTTLTEVFRLLAVADPNLAQIPQSHVVFLQALRESGTRDQQQRFFAEALAGRRFANAQSERSSRTVAEDRTTLTRRADGDYLLRGEKFYATGSLFAHWLVVRAVLPDESRADGSRPKALAYLRADTPGVTIEDDWDALGQRTTGSGTVRLEDVVVPTGDVVPFTPIFDRPTVYGSLAQVLHAALDVGIARAAVIASVAQVARARPWFESGADRAADDPLLVQQAGEIEITVRAAEALVRDAARQIEAARPAPDEHNTAEASVATAVARVAAARAAVDASSALFELAGTRSVVDSLNLSRYWRDARTHTLHDPSRWKVQHIGRWVIDDVAPPRHGLL